MTRTAMSTAQRTTRRADAGCAGDVEFAVLSSGLPSYVIKQPRGQTPG